MRSLKSEIFATESHVYRKESSSTAHSGQSNSLAELRRLAHLLKARLFFPRSATNDKKTMSGRLALYLLSILRAYNTFERQKTGGWTPPARGTRIDPPLFSLSFWHNSVVPRPKRSFHCLDIGRWVQIGRLSEDLGRVSEVQVFFPAPWLPDRKNAHWTRRTSHNI